ncbi:calnexin, putative [Ixodes scapularis]|uniref:Calnexin, putative n=1 Tax=Ixodes scapularis TaxID=6945 RepID=B7PGQ2_IXOSC|nr:calnexin, putative [Ixodes scapularis]|eukprot:XP_002401232.1 calnexin, putative [Ixodes scapularis]
MHFCLVLLLLVPGALCEGEEEKVSKVEPAEDVVYNVPKPVGFAHIAEHFDDLDAFKERWVLSEATKDGAESSVAKYDGKWQVEAAARNHLRGDLGLVLKVSARHHAIAAKLDRPYLFEHKPFVLQYEVQFQEGQDCGGAYIKLLSDLEENRDLRQFHDKSPYTIMFGPDKCGTDHKLHLIFRHRNPRNGSYEEKHWKKSGGITKFDEVFKDKRPHLFTLVLTPDNHFEVLVDQRSEAKGSLLEDFEPAVNPPAEVEDPTDVRPADWDEREKVPDATATKPEDWDEEAPRQIPDPDATKPVGWLDDEPALVPDAAAERPKDWDDDMDGEWEPPLVNNPKCTAVGCGEWKPPLVDNPRYKGKWRAPLVDNPNYKGKWRPRKIPNPHFYEDSHPFRMTPVSAVGFELWSMSEGILFDNVLITDDPVVADQWAADTWLLKKEAGDRETDGLLTRLLKYTNKYPWLWAVYVVALGLPLVLIVGFCCSSSQDKKAQHKKSDDVPAEEEEEPREEAPAPIEEEEEEEEGAGGEASASNEEGSGDGEDVDGGAGDAKRSPRRRRPRRE